MTERTQGEKITALEVELSEFRKQTSEEIADIGAKLDSLLELKNKGMGAFWLISILMGAAFTVITTFVADWFN